MVEANFLLHDEDGNGVISLGEFLSASDQQEVPRAKAKRAFSKADADKDKVLSFKEYLDATSAFGRLVGYQG